MRGQTVLRKYFHYGSLLSTVQMSCIFFSNHYLLCINFFFFFCLLLSDQLKGAHVYRYLFPHPSRTHQIGLGIWFSNIWSISTEHYSAIEWGRPVLLEWHTLLLNRPLIWKNKSLTHLVTVCWLGIRVGAQGAGTHHEEEKCQESPHHGQQHRILHAACCDGRPWTWHCKY